MSTNIDERLEEAEKTVDAELEAEITKSDDAYDDRIEANEQKEQDIHNQIGVQDENGNWNEGSWADTQTDIQNEQTEFTIDQIELQKDRAESDYIKEQSGAYKDWQKQSDPYGVNAEQRAAQGLTNTGYSESSQVSMYNTYQNRVATARESFQRAIVDYDNAIAQARLANNAALAEIAAQALAQRMEATLQFVQINNALLSEKTNAQLTLKSMYQDKWKAMLDKILQEAALAQDQAQFDATMAFNREQFEWQKAQAESSGGGGSSGGSGGGTIIKDSGGGSGGGGAITGGSTGSGNSGGGSGNGTNKNAIANYARNIKTNGERYTYLQNCVKAGSLTEDEAKKIYDTYYRVSTSNWTSAGDGGINWGFGKNNVDWNAKYKNEMGETYTAKELYNALKKEGMSAESAKNYVLIYQKQFNH